MNTPQVKAFNLSKQDLERVEELLKIIPGQSDSSKLLSALELAAEVKASRDMF